jgi:hypothetical protein
MQSSIEKRYRREKCRTSWLLLGTIKRMNGQRFAEATPIDKAWEEIANGTFLDGFKETSESHPLPPEVLEYFSESSEIRASEGCRRSMTPSDESLIETCVLTISTRAMAKAQACHGSRKCTIIVSEPLNRRTFAIQFLSPSLSPTVFGTPCSPVSKTHSISRPTRTTVSDFCPTR